MKTPVQDIKPRTPVAALGTRATYSEKELGRRFDLDLVSALVGMSPTYVRRALGLKAKTVRLEDVLTLLDLDSYAETFVPRSRVPRFLLGGEYERWYDKGADKLDLTEDHTFELGDAGALIRSLPAGSVRCVVTSTPYWGLRLYGTHFGVEWADGEVCPLGHEQTPEGFVRHTIELLYHLKRVMREDGSVWWNLMDTFNTRTQIRGSAAETLRAMKGEDDRGWGEHACRRYSAGHSYLEDGEAVMIPGRVAERASRIGFWLRSSITWKKAGSMPETVSTRVAREGESILHLTLQRNPYFDKEAFRSLPVRLGGRNPRLEYDKVTDVWCLPTASGQDGHGAQFPLALPGRCIGLSTELGDMVLDPFVGSGTTSLASAELGRRSIGFDVDADYLETARSRLKAVTEAGKPMGGADGVNKETLGLYGPVQGDGQLDDSLPVLGASKGTGC